MSGLPPADWPLTTGEKITPPWYNYLKSADATWRPTVTNVSSLTTAANPVSNLLSNSGVSILEQVPASTMFLALPSPGCRKTICVASTSTTGRVSIVNSTVHQFRNQSTVAGSTGWVLNFTSSAPYKAVELLGISTLEYLIVSNIGNVTVST